MVGILQSLRRQAVNCPYLVYSRKAFVQAIGESVPPRGINQTFEIALWLPCFADVDAEYERLSKMDLRFPTGGPMTFPSESATFMLPTRRETCLKSAVQVKRSL